MDYISNVSHVYRNLGYTSTLCLNKTNLSIVGEFTLSKKPHKFNCERTDRKCDFKNEYLCPLPCHFKYKELTIDGSRFTVKEIDIFPQIPFAIANNTKETVFHNNSVITLNTYGNLSLLRRSEISINMTTDSKIYCNIIEFKSHLIACRIDLSKLNSYEKILVNVSVLFGLKECGNITRVGSIYIKRREPFEKFMETYYWIIVVFSILLLLFICGLLFFYKTRNFKRNVNNVNIRYKKQLDDQENKFVQTQKQAFLEYQTAVDLFQDLGSLTSRHTLSFYNYISRVFNVELSKESSIYPSYQTDDFRKFILNKENLIKWVEKMENGCKLKQRSLVASLLSIVLFQHPAYFLEILKFLLSKNIKEMKSRGEERLAFRRSEAFVEKLIGNWIALCMYKCLKKGDVGKRFFNLYRAIKCKMNQGIVDCITNKAKYALTFDHILLGDIASEVLNIKADVNINLKMMNTLKSSLQIKLDRLDVEVLSLDSISQVKEKIIDKAIMVYSEKEENCNNLENDDLCVGLQDINDFRLQLMNNTTKIMLDDFDRTSITSVLDKNCLMINTMKHYNMKSGMCFFLDSLAVVDNIQFDKVLLSSKKIKIHLQLPQNYKIQSLEMSKQQTVETNSKLLFNPVIENMNKESYLMVLMAAKQSVLAFIDGFFQSVFNWNPNQVQGTSSNSLFENVDIPLLDKMIPLSQNIISNENYLTPIYYLFSMLDNIAKSLDITDKLAILVWKSNSFILRFWVNLIKNPNFIFSVEETGPINGSLTTIASVLMESCSVSVGETVVDVNIPIIKQLFLKELKRYKSWWQSFTELATPIEETSMIQMMNSISETYGMASHYHSSLASLQAISNTLFPELFTTEENDFQ